MADKTLYDVIIVGGASAGLTAALYTSRQNLKTLVITKDIGGQALLTDRIQNYPGFKDIGGFELMVKFQEQAQDYGAEFQYDEVTSVSRNDGVFNVRTVTGEFNSRSVILAFGKTPRDLGVKGEQEFKGRGVSYCSICDGPLYKGKDVALTGIGDHAIQSAIYLGNVASHVTFISPAKELRGEKESIDSVRSMRNVEILNAKSVTEIRGDETLNSVVISDSEKKMDEIRTNALFVEMGYVSRSDIVANLVKLNDEKEIIVDMNCNTSMPGVFACGDVTQIPYKQAVISAGMGATAALSAYNYVMGNTGRYVKKTDWKLAR
ncbi:MAG: FAD-dependent oxidoreductase [Candidatus Thermoplasmatota archaeon]|nr:FAD-dependent oxidoreductase [Candidatus Thermoplasmatota archaeon]MCL5665374.1 FAD-dependent oxidoreductase [Candidatus Thermoplasmatota archaeon]